MARSDSVTVTTLDWVVIGAGVLAYVASFLPWYGASISVFGVGGSASVNAWNAGFGAWFSVLLVVASGVTLVSMMAARLRLPVSRSLITLGLSALAVVTILLRWVTYPDASRGSGDLADISVDSLVTASSGAGSGLYLGLIAALAAVVASLLAFRAEGGTFGTETPSPTAPPTA